MKPSLSCFYFPTTVMLVDDNFSFIENLSFNLNKTHSFLLYDNPQCALLKIQENKKNSIQKSPFHEYIIDNEYDLDVPNNLFEINYSAMYSKIYHSHRFSDISTVVVDYSMPSLDGLEFCRQIKSLPLKKIMLTGLADYKIAVAAFNEGIIDYFILKDGEALEHEVNDCLKSARQQYFLDLSQSVMANTPWYHSADYQKAWEHYLHSADVVEYYQIDGMGSYVGLTRSGKLSWFVVTPESEIQKYLDIARGNHASSRVIDALFKRQYLLFLLSDVEKRLPVSEWDNYIFPIQGSFMANERHYYSIIFSANFSLDLNQIKPWDSYMKNCQPAVLR